MTELAAIVGVFSPLLGAALAGLGSQWLKDFGSQVVTCALMLISVVAFCFVGMDVLVAGNNTSLTLLNWIDVDFLKIEWGIALDSLTAVMLLVVTFVSLMVHIYSIGYMHHDHSIPRFMSYLSLFTFFMLMLVVSPNLVQMFFGWEGVGLASYLLIGFWYDRESANAAAIKAFLVNRVGDVGFALGIFTIFVIFGTVDFSDFLGDAAGSKDKIITFWGYEFGALNLAAFLLFMGAMGKSAQLGLHTWLPDAMEGPTPVSALIHAATMVTAGVFMVVRLSPLLEYTPLIRDFITVIGALTALFAATVACTQNDIKRVIAYSTCSQLGYMFMAAGVSAYGASMFHLTTHAFFKAMLFLGAGSVIHAMSDEQDMRNMGGIWKMIPYTYVLMWVGSLALAGIPWFAGYYSKDIIIESLWANGGEVGRFAFYVGIFAAILTAFYSWRLLIMTFHGKPRADEMVMGHIHESPMVMLAPVSLLGVGAIFSGYLLFDSFVGDARIAFWGDSIGVLGVNDSIELVHHVPFMVALIPTISAVFGIGVAYLLYLKFTSIPSTLANRFTPFYEFLLNKWYFDELYNKLFINPSLVLARLFWKKGDVAIIDGLGPNGTAYLSYQVGGVLSSLQTGYLFHYAFAMILGVALMVAMYLMVILG